MHTTTTWDIKNVERPGPKLMTYYFLSALAALPFFPLVLLYYWFRYNSLRYRFDGEGISMSWGILFRREIHLTYARIQDIHLVSNIVERWLGLARIQIQTASGQADSEMTLEGIMEYAEVRDYLYSRLRGAAPQAPGTAATKTGETAATDDPAGQSLAREMLELSHELRALREALAAKRGGS